MKHFEREFPSTGAFWYWRREVGGNLFRRTMERVGGGGLEFDAEHESINYRSYRVCSLT